MVGRQVPITPKDRAISSPTLVTLISDLESKAHNIHHLLETTHSKLCTTPINEGIYQLNVEQMNSSSAHSSRHLTL